MLRVPLTALFGLACAGLLVLSMFKGGDWVDEHTWWWLTGVMISAALAGESWYGLITSNNRGLET